MSRILFAAKHLFVGSYICRSYGELSASEKEGRNTLNDNYFIIHFFQAKAVPKLNTVICNRNACKMMTSPGYSNRADCGRHFVSFLFSRKKYQYTVRP